jgi:hypothetical protein
MIKFYVTDENANRREFARYDNGKWSGNSRAVLVILEHKEWPQLGDRTFDKNNPEDYDMLPELFIIDIVIETEEEDDWMKSLPGYEDEVKIHERLGRKLKREDND